MAVATTRTARSDLVASVREVAAATYIWTIGLLASIVLFGGIVGYTPVVITSGSMEPSIRPGDVVLLREPGGDPPAPPSVVTFASGSGELITHRVIDTLPDESFVTKGDANMARRRRPEPDDHEERSVHGEHEHDGQLRSSVLRHPGAASRPGVGGGHADRAAAGAGLQRRNADVFFATTDAPSPVTIDVSP